MVEVHLWAGRDNRRLSATNLLSEPTQEPTLEPRNEPTTNGSRETEIIGLPCTTLNQRRVDTLEQKQII